MSTYPRELIFRERKDIDEFLSEPGLNSSLYELLLSVREPNDVRYALKVTPLQIFNEAYGQALRVLLDRHPEEDYYNNYFLNAKKYFTRSYEADLVFCVVYVLLKFCNMGTPNIDRFLTVFENRMKDKPMYFPEFQKFCNSISKKRGFNKTVDRFYLHTDTITPKDYANINWSAATFQYNEEWIKYYVDFGVDTEQQVAMIDCIRSNFELDQLFEALPTPDIKPFMDRLKANVQKFPKAPSPIPEINATYSSHVQVQAQESESLKAEVARLRAENEELRKHRAEEVSEERTTKIKDIVEIAKTLPSQECKTVFNVVRLLVAEQDNNWIEKVDAEERVLESRSLDAAKYRIANRRNTDFIKIISAMYDCRMFMTPDGLLASNKQDVMNEFGKLLQADMSNYSGLLSRAKNADNFLEVFEQLKEAANKYYEQ